MEVRTMMTRTPAPPDAMSALFRKIVLVLGGVFAIDGTPDATIARAAAGLERAWLRALRTTEATAAPPRRLTPHPDIARLLRLVDGDGPDPDSTAGDGHPMRAASGQPPFDSQEA
jgi:hypothetical protein